jgi:uncharacterized protein YdhG (YjbR/CyaY superfamily)
MAPGPIEAYLATFAESDAEIGRELVGIMSEALPGAEERVQWGIAILSIDGKDVMGIAIRKGFFSLYVPNGTVASSFRSRLGKVDAGKGCIRFKKSGDLDRAAFRELVNALRDSALGSVGSPEASPPRVPTSNRGTKRRRTDRGSST